MPLITSTSLPILAALATLELAAAWAASELPPGVWGETALVPYCLAGSVLGGLLAVGVIPANDTTRRLAVKGSCSAIGGLLFTDVVMAYFSIPLTKGNVIGTAGGVAFIAVSALTPLIAIAVPKWERFVRKRADKLAELAGLESTELPTRREGQ